MNNQPDGAHPFSLFFLVTHSDEAKDCNLEYTFTSISGKFSLSIPAPASQSLDIELAAKSIPQMPVMLNNKAIAKHTQLVCLNDLNLQKAQQQMDAAVAKGEKTKGGSKKTKTDDPDSAQPKKKSKPEGDNKNTKTDDPDKAQPKKKSKPA